jgi:hypothetical protein
MSGGGHSNGGAGRGLNTHRNITSERTKKPIIVAAANKRVFFIMAHVRYHRQAEI